jgi:hypothetical protein
MLGVPVCVCAATCPSVAWSPRWVFSSHVPLQHGLLSWTGFYGFKNYHSVFWITPVMAFSIVVGIALDCESRGGDHEGCMCSWSGGGGGVGVGWGWGEGVGVCVRGGGAYLDCL